jgi:probable phosphoglycerate mutase
MKRLIFVRHGESEWNASRRLQGQADMELSARGRDQARALIPIVASLAPDHAVVSSLKRAVQTAELLGFPEAEKMDALREVDVGEWTGASIDDLIARDAKSYRGWRMGAHTPPGGESWTTFKDRINRAIESLLSGDASRIVAVSHGGVLRALLEGLIGLSPARIVPVGPGSITVLRHNAVNGACEVRLELFNFAPGGLALDVAD